MLEIVRDAVFDTIFAPENLRDGKGYLFRIPVGQYAGRQVKQFEHTSMLLAGQLPSLHKFLIKSFHCCLFDPDPFGGLIPVSDRTWDGTFALEINCRRVYECALREMYDPDIREKIRSRVVDQKYYNVQHLENPDVDVEEFEAAVSGKLQDRKDLFLIETQEAFIGRVSFDHPVRVPFQAIFALNGVLARAVC